LDAISVNGNPPPRHYAGNDVLAIFVKVVQKSGRRLGEGVASTEGQEVIELRLDGMQRGGAPNKSPAFRRGHEL